MSVVVPESVQEIPPESPVYNVKYVYIYDSTPEVVYVGYTPGYVHSYAYHGCVYYGTGYHYGYHHGYHNGYRHGYRPGYNAGNKPGYGRPTPYNNQNLASNNVYKNRSQGVKRTGDTFYDPKTGN